MTLNYPTCCYPFLGSHKTKQKWKWENTKKIYQKIFEGNPKIIWVRKGCWNAEKRTEIDWGGSKIQELKIDSIFLTEESPVDKENSSWGRKI